VCEFLKTLELPLRARSSGRLREHAQCTGPPDPDVLERNRDHGKHDLHLATEQLHRDRASG